MKIRFLSLCLLFAAVLSCTAVSATWYFAESRPFGAEENLTLSMTPWVEIPDQEVDIVNHFANILNGREPCNLKINGKSYTNSFDAFIAAMDSSPTAYVSGKRVTLHNNSYIGTMQTKGDDVAAIRTLFGDVLVDEENAAEEYSLMLKRDPIDGNHLTGQSYYMSGDHGWAEENAFYPGAEIIMFSTNWQAGQRYGYVIVYATVYTRYPLTDAAGNYIYDLDKDGNVRYYTYTNASGRTVTTGYPIYRYGEWVRISGEDAFVGEAQVVNYSTGDTTRSFDTGSWRSSSEYGGNLSGATLSAMVASVLNKK